MKKSMGGATSFDRRDSRGSERGERGGGGGGGGFFSDSRSRADEADNWLAKKSFTPSPVEPRRERRGGGGFESGYQRDIPIGGGADGDSWGKKRGEEVSESVGRPRLVLQPRSVPISNGEQQQQQRPTSGSGSRPGSASGPKSNPFGAARPREEVLGERGEDWKKIDEHLEEMKIKEIQEIKEEPSFGKKSFGSGNGRMSSPEDRTERSWRRTSSVESSTLSVENVEHAENPDKDDDSVVSGN
ncbi:hypothetical protein IFM89_027411 [Coptis chinensis]|uniref:Uncharacterized protein n=1 Tax=Coptis chinensis TaxID=261450 RepID=A0A835M6P3_9MAGN|nr:hypothetical protein IFM89_027411 [Coptis chinensis]